MTSLQSGLILMRLLKIFNRVSYGDQAVTEFNRCVEIFNRVSNPVYSLSEAAANILLTRCVSDTKRGNTSYIGQ